MFTNTKQVYFDSLCADRKCGFEINVELQIRKLLERKTDYNVEVKKHLDKYGRDLEVFIYKVDGNDWSYKNCFLEVEVSEKWIDTYPIYWRWYSFLARKVFLYNTNNNYNDRIPLADYKNVYYIIFNKNLTDAISQPVYNIAEFDLHLQHISGEDRTDWFLRVPVSDKRIVRGIDNVVLDLCNFVRNT